MDFIFEEDSDDVGADIEAYCPKCKSDTSHTVITKYEDEIRRVQCSPCGDVHAYRKPRGEVEEEIPEPAAAKKRAAAKKPTWQEAMDKAGNRGIANARPYSIRDSYKEGDIVTHPKFGNGFVTEISENKVEITFQDERRVLVHNRPDLASVMPAIASIPLPRDDKKRKGQKAGKKGAPVVAPPPAAKGKVPAAKPTGKPIPAPVKPAAAQKQAPAAKGKGVQGKVERAKAAATKKGAAKGKPAAKPARRPARAAAPAKKKAPRPAARAAARHAPAKKKPVKKAR